MRLNSEQISFFRSNGYLIVPGALDEELCAHVRDMMWEALPEGSSLHREDPAAMSVRSRRMNPVRTVFSFAMVIVG